MKWTISTRSTDKRQLPNSPTRPDLNKASEPREMSVFCLHFGDDETEVYPTPPKIVICSLSYIHVRIYFYHTIYVCVYRHTHTQRYNNSTGLLFLLRLFFRATSTGFTAN